MCLYLLKYKIKFLTKHFQLTPALVGFSVSGALLGCVFGSFIASKFNEKYGRKKVLIVGAICYSVSALYSAIPANFTIFVLARILGGIGIGLSSSSVPLYISEIAPAKIRGFLGAFFQISVSLGMLVVFYVNYKICNANSIDWNYIYGWRWMFASELVPAITFFILLFFIPESPRWLLSKNEDEKAKKIIGMFNSQEQVKAEIDAVKQNIIEENQKKSSSNGIPKEFKKVLFLCVVMAFLSQVAGINVILYYSPVVLSTVGAGGDPYFQSVIIGLIMVTAAVLASLTSDRIGRKKIFIIGTFFMSIFMILMGFEIYYEKVSYRALVYVMGYVFAFCYSVGPIVWIYVSEVLPNSIRASGMALASLVIWASNILVSQTFPILNDSPILKLKFNL